MSNVCRYVRREKEIAETRRELAVGENLRYKQELKSAQRQLASAQAELDQIRDSAASRSVTAAQHAEILKKVSLLSNHSQYCTVCALKNESKGVKKQLVPYK